MGFIKYLCKKHGIKLVPASCLPDDIDPSFKNGSAIAAGACEPDSPPIIVYDDERVYFERNYVILHELGHILLGHTTLDNLKDEAAELEANVFAAMILAQAVYKEYEAEVNAINQTC